MRLLTQTTTTFTGEYFQLVDGRCNPKAVQSPHPPIVIGGKGPKRTLKVVARWADMWDTFPESLEAWQATRSILDEHCAAIGRNPSEIRSSIHLSWPADADPAALAAQAAPYLGIADLVIFSMRGPYHVELLEPLANELQKL